MRTSVCQLFLLAFCFGVSAGTAHARLSGVESGGGGGVLITAPGPVLLDYLNLNPQFKDVTTYAGLTASRINVANTASFSLSGQAEVVRSANPAFELALKTLEAWEQLPFDYAGTLISAAFVSPVRWNYIEDKLSAAYVLPPSVSIQAKVEIAGYYLSKDRVFTVQLSRRLWNQMGLLSQAGLLTHEALRHVQLGLTSGFDEKVLQQATAIVMMCEPNSRLSYYLQYLVINQPARAQQLYGSFDSIVASDCKRKF